MKTTNAFSFSILIMTLLWLPVHGQKFDWVKTIQCNSMIYSSGHIYRSSKDTILSMHNENGTLIWKKNGPSGALANDKDGNIFVAGNFNNSVNIGGQNLTSKGNLDFFIAKYTKDGDFQWVKQYGGAYQENVSSVALDGSGNIYLFGEFRDTAFIGSNTIPSKGEGDIFLARLSPAGDLQWLRSAGSDNFDMAYHMAVDAGGNAYLCGSALSDMDFGGGNKTTNQGSSDAYLAKYDNSGTVQWVKSFGGMWADDLRAVAVDNDGWLYSCGKFAKTVKINGKDEVFDDLGDIVILKFKSDGTFGWFKKAGSDYVDGAYAMASNNNGSIYVAGSFSNTGDFGDGKTVVSSGEADAFIAKFNTADGKTQWVKKAGGEWEDDAYLLALDEKGAVYIGGALQGDGDFDNIHVPGSFSGIYYMAHITGDPSGIRQPEVKETLSFYPNPSSGNIQIQGPASTEGQLSLEIMNLEGQVVYHSLYNHNDYISGIKLELDLPAGIYMAKMQCAGKSWTGEIMIR